MHLLSTRELVDLPTEVALSMALRGAATQALVSGLSCVDAQLKVDREPIRTMAAAAVKCKRADRMHELRRRRPRRAALHRSHWLWLRWE